MQELVELGEMVRFLSECTSRQRNAVERIEENVDHAQLKVHSGQENMTAVQIPLPPILLLTVLHSGGKIQQIPASCKWSFGGRSYRRSHWRSNWSLSGLKICLCYCNNRYAVEVGEH